LAGTRQLIVALALLEAAKQQRGVNGIDVALACGSTILALVLSLAIGRWRNLGSFTRLAFWLCCSAKSEVFEGSRSRRHGDARLER